MNIYTRNTKPEGDPHHPEDLQGDNHVAASSGSTQELENPHVPEGRLDLTPTGNTPNDISAYPTIAPGIEGIGLQAENEGQPDIPSNLRNATSPGRIAAGGVHINQQMGTESPSMAEILVVMKEQAAILRSMNERQAAQDLSHQPIPNVPRSSSSAWNALHKTLMEQIQPKLERWRGGLDALLVFLGLFSAIVTAFFVDSLNGLQQSDSAKTNELLANLTEIIVVLSGTNVTLLNLRIPHPEPFEPDASNVRLNVYWSISLILSLAIAALAIAGRGYTNMVTWSRHTQAMKRVTDIKTRWKRAEAALSPAIESVHQLLIIPLLLFITGLLDSLFSSVLEIESPHRPIPILVASYLSVFFMVCVGVALLCALLDGAIRPCTSPFQSSLAKLLRSLAIKTLRPFWRVYGSTRNKMIHRGRIRGIPSLYSLDYFLAYRDKFYLERHSYRAYHEITQATHADDTLDQAAAALLDTTILAPNIVRDSEESLQLHSTIMHLLSPEASMRSNYTAAQILIQFAQIGRLKCLTDPNIHDVMAALAQAALRLSSTLPRAPLWESLFINSIGELTDSDRKLAGYPPIVRILVTEGSILSTWGSQARLVWDILSNELPDTDDQSVEALMAPCAGTEVVKINPRHVLVNFSVLVGLYGPGLYPSAGAKSGLTLLRVVCWLMKITTPREVIYAALDQLSTHAQTHRLYTIPLAIAIARTWLDSGDEAENELVVLLCIRILEIPADWGDTRKVGLVLYLPILLKVLRKTSMPHHESPLFTIILEWLAIFRMVQEGDPSDSHLKDVVLEFNDTVNYLREFGKPLSDVSEAASLRLPPNPSNYPRSIPVNYRPAIRGRSVRPLAFSPTHPVEVHAPIWKRALGAFGKTARRRHHTDTQDEIGVLGSRIPTRSMTHSV